MSTSRPSGFAVAATLSFATSLVLAAIPFAFPTTPIGPFALANWVFFMAAGYLGCPRPFWRDFLAKPDPETWQVLRLVLIAFAVGGWIAVSKSSVIF